MNCSQTTHLRSICQFHTSTRRVCSSQQSHHRNSSIVHGKCELDSHADTTVAGANCTVLHFTGQECDVSPFRDDYEPISKVKICHAATAWQSPHTGQVYILVFNEALWMGDSMSHSLINPNQLRHFGTQVQDNPTSNKPLSIITEDSGFAMDLKMAGTIVYADTFTPTDEDLSKYPHIQLTSENPWDPIKITFPSCPTSLEDELGGPRYISAVDSQIQHTYSIETDDDDDVADNLIFNIPRFNRRISSISKYTKSLEKDPLVKPDVDTGTTDAPLLNTFVSSD